MQLTLHIIKRSTNRNCALLFLLGYIGVAHAVPPLLLDDFSLPSPKVSGSVQAAGDQFFNRTFGSFAGVPSQAREVNLNMISADVPSTLSLGEGSANYHRGDGSETETVFNYGWFTHPDGNPSNPGPSLSLDLRSYNDLQLVFSSIWGLNNTFVLTLYTSAPLLKPNGQPLNILQSGVQFEADTPGPATADLLIDTRNPLANADAPYFNYAKVDGISLTIDGAATNGQSELYALVAMEFIPGLLVISPPIPEPGTGLLFGAGVGLVAARLRRWKKPNSGVPWKSPSH